MFKKYGNPCCYCHFLNKEQDKGIHLQVRTGGNVSLQKGENLWNNCIQGQITSFKERLAIWLACLLMFLVICFKWILQSIWIKTRMRKADFMTGVRELAASGAVQDPREKQSPSLDLSFSVCCHHRRTRGNFGTLGVQSWNCQEINTLWWNCGCIHSSQGNHVFCETLEQRPVSLPVVSGDILPPRCQGYESDSLCSKTQSRLSQSIPRNTWRKLCDSATLFPGIMHYYNLNIERIDSSQCW